MEIVSLLWERCPDGARIEQVTPQETPPSPLIGSLARGILSSAIDGERTERGERPSEPHIVFKSGARVLTRHETRSLERPLVLVFANAKSDQQLVRFVADHGFPKSLYFGIRITPDSMSLAELRQSRERIAEALSDAGSADDLVAKQAVDWSGRPAIYCHLDISGDQRRASYHVASMEALMAHELHLIALHNVRVSFCENCGDQFLTGARTTHRSHRIYCSDRCRKAALRTKARGDDGSPQAIETAARRAEIARLVEETRQRHEAIRYGAEVLAEHGQADANSPEIPFRVPYL